MHPEVTSSNDVLGGEPRIEDTRIGVAEVAMYHTELGWTVEKIASELGLEPREVLAALEYYYDHSQEVQKYMSKRDPAAA